MTKNNNVANYGLQYAHAHWQLDTAALYERALFNGEAELSAYGSLLVDTGQFTGRSPQDKFIVRDSKTEDTIDWGEINQPMSPQHFASLKASMFAFLQDREVYVQDLYVGADETHRIPTRIITEYAWHSLFSRNMLIREAPSEDASFYTVIDLPSFKANPSQHGSRGETIIAVNFSERLVLVAGTEYSGEIKKSLFSIMNYELTDHNVMPMHCSANHDDEGNIAVFFGLSGTGKTTLSADKARTLIGDDEHGWTDEGIFNFEGGCYAKVIDLSKKKEPEIYQASHQFGAILENVIYDPDSREIDFNDDSKTENTRSSYPIHFIPNASRTSQAGHPNHIVFLTADAFGVLPPISKLNPEQAMYHFLSGYTAKVAGTECGITEPVPNFSTCFGSPFLPRKASIYAELLGQKIQEHDVHVWLVNTGWTGGAYGVGSRMKLRYTRAMVNAAIVGNLDGVPTKKHPIFNLRVLQNCPYVPSSLLNPKNTWEDPEAYDAQARKLADMFKENFKRFENDVSEAVRQAGPL